MKKFGFITLSLVVFSLIFTPIVRAEDCPGLISAKGSVSMDVEPDTAIFSVAVRTEAQILKKGIEENNAKSQKVYENLKNILGNDDKIKTTRYQVNPIYNYNNKKREQVGYNISNEVKVETKQLDKVGKMIETALDNGANQIAGLNYSISDNQKYCAELLNKAAQKARKEAEILATSLGVKIVGIKKVSSNCNGESSRPYMDYALSEVKGRGAAPPLEAGELTIYANVYIDFIIE